MKPIELLLLSILYPFAISAMFAIKFVKQLKKSVI